MRILPGKILVRGTLDEVFSVEEVWMGKSGWEVSRFQKPGLKVGQPLRGS